jgi:hypothetical protein
MLPALDRAFSCAICLSKRDLEASFNRIRELCAGPDYATARNIVAAGGRLFPGSLDDKIGKNLKSFAAKWE